MNEQVEAVQRMQDYIEKNLETEITLASLSEISLFSPWHSYRLFKNYLGITPAQYLRKLRLSNSAMRLKKEQCFVTNCYYASRLSKKKLLMCQKKYDESRQKPHFREFERKSTLYLV